LKSARGPWVGQHCSTCYTLIPVIAYHLGTQTFANEGVPERDAIDGDGNFFHDITPFIISCTKQISTRQSQTYEPIWCHINMC